MFKKKIDFKKELSKQLLLISRPISYREKERNSKLFWLDKNENISDKIFQFIKKKN